jgi:hypothetical protein
MVRLAAAFIIFVSIVLGAGSVRSMTSSKQFDKTVFSANARTKLLQY